MAEAANTVKAMAILNGDQVKGKISLEQSADGGPTKITGTVTGLPQAGKYGFHVHEFGDLSRGCDSAGAHYNPQKVEHGAPEDDAQHRHVGDLGNIEADEKGEAAVNIQDSLVSLVGKFSVIGRSIVVHERADDLGRGGNPDSKKTGNAGGRRACGVIGIAP